MRRLLALALAGAAIAGCGGDEEAGGQEPAAGLAVPWVNPDGEPPYIGSIDVNPADQAIYMGTNTGLFRIPEGAEEPERITGTLTTPDGEGQVSESLVATFTGPDTLLASGHPAEGAALPPALGLIRSEDAGRTWESISELGSADFHALELSGDRLVGALFGQSQVLVSDDDGRTWEARTAPMPLVDLEVDPSNPDLWIGTTEQGIFRSEDAGGTWRQRDPTPNVRVAWADDGELFRIDPGGYFQVSTDGGSTWEERGSTGGEPHALTVAEDGTIYAALLDGAVKASEDGGQTFTDRVAGG
jgi:photosystem II stability/assembly factor-like uncharacterized protein